MHLCSIVQKEKKKTVCKIILATGQKDACKIAKFFFAPKAITARFWYNIKCSLELFQRTGKKISRPHS